MEYNPEETSSRLLSPTDLGSDDWLGAVKRIRDEKRPLTADGLQALRDEHTRTIVSARALAA